jgi:predicted GH43/DUF377 family glycosyl hydrolase
MHSVHKQHRDLGVLATDKQVLLYTNLVGEHDHPIQAGTSNDGLNFKKASKNSVLINTQGEQENTTGIDTFRISSLDKSYVAFYKKHHAEKATLHIAQSKDAFSWKTLPVELPFQETAMIVPDYTYDDVRVAYYGDTEIKAAFTTDLTQWQLHQETLLSPRNAYFDKQPLEIGSVIVTDKGIVVIYFVRTQSRDGNHYAIGAAMFDKKDPTRLIWRSDKPLWQQHEEWNGKTVYPMGAVHFKESFILYFGIEGEGVHAVHFNSLTELLDGKGIIPAPQLKKSAHNPIITPVLKHSWEASAVFNAAAVYEGGKVHIVYRAMGPNNTSVLGYAASSDGETIDERADEPIYYPTEPFEVPGKYPSIHFMSGGGYGGCEDPRITKVDDTFYMTLLKLMIS